MSGKFNQSTGGWVMFKPQTSAGKLAAYDNRIVVIVSNTKSGAKVYLPSAVMKAIGNPDWVDIGTRGSNVGIMKAEVAGRGSSYRVASNMKDGKDIGMRFLNLHAFVKQHNIPSGVYDAHLESGVVIFDMASTPSRF